MDVRKLTEDTYALLGLECPAPVPYEFPADPSKEEMAAYIDHTILKSDCSSADIRRICDEAKEHHFASVCVNPSFIALAAKELEGTDVTPCCVIGFPFGTQTPEAKAFEAADAVGNGAREVDMVINVGALKDRNWELSFRDINEVVKAMDGRARLKVIIETCLLTDEEKVRICAVAMAAGADFVKTSTGYSTGGATAEDVALMRQTVGGALGVKASGGIRTYEDALKMVKAGASRLGCSAGVKIVS